MRTSLSLRNMYTSERALCDPDPQVRIAAIHHAAVRLGEGDDLTALLLERVSDEDPVVSRYAAVTLAQTGCVEGMRYLLHAVDSSGGADRCDLDRCLRNCTQFPFAILLNETVYLESIRDVTDEKTKEALHELISVSTGQVSVRSQQEPQYPEAVIALLVSLTGIERLRSRGAACYHGAILSTPRLGHPGFIVSRGGLFFQFHEATIINRERCAEGREVLFPVRTEDTSGTAGSVFVLEREAKQSAQFADADAFERHANSELPVPSNSLLPAMIAGSLNTDDRAFAILTARGELFEQSFAQPDAAPGRLGLVEAANAPGRRRCHLVEKFPNEQLALESIIRRGGFVFGQIAAVSYKKRGPRVVRVERKGQPALKIESTQGELGEHAIFQRCDQCFDKAELTEDCTVCKGKGAFDSLTWPQCPSCGGTGEVSASCDACGDTGWVLRCVLERVSEEAVSLAQM